MNHCEKHDVITDVQHGVCQKRSCESQLLETVDDLAFNIDHGKQTDVIMLDFRKAFDTVPLLRLMSKLDQLDISGPIYNWLKTFLVVNRKSSWTEWSQRLKSDIRCSSRHGHGPSSFLLYINHNIAIEKLSALGVWGAIVP